MIPTENYRIYVFKNKDDMLEMRELSKKSVFLFGKKREVCDWILDNPTVSS